MEYSHGVANSQARLKEHTHTYTHTLSREHGLCYIYVLSSLHEL